MFSATEDKRPNIIIKDTPIVLTTQEIPRVSGAISQELWVKSKYIWDTHVGHLNDQICVFLIITILHSQGTLYECSAAYIPNTKHRIWHKEGSQYLLAEYMIEWMRPQQPLSLDLDLILCNTHSKVRRGSGLVLCQGVPGWIRAPCKPQIYALHSCLWGQPPRSHKSPCSNLASELGSLLSS